MFLGVARVLLILDSLIFIMVGLFSVTDPTGRENLDIVTASGITAIRTWGGLLFGVGLVGLIASLAKKWIAQGLFVLFVVGGMIVLSRLYGIAIDGVEPKQLTELRDESLGPLLAATGLFFLWIRQRRSSRS